MIIMSQKVLDGKAIFGKLKEINKMASDLGTLDQDLKALIQDIEAGEYDLGHSFNSTKLIGNVRDRFGVLIRKNYDWPSFYCGWIEGRASLFFNVLLTDPASETTSSLKNLTNLDPGITPCTNCQDFVYKQAQIEILEELQTTVGDMAISHHQKAQAARSPPDWAPEFSARDALRTLNHDVIGVKLAELRGENMEENL